MKGGKKDWKEPLSPFSSQVVRESLLFPSPPPPPLQSATKREESSVVFLCVFLSLFIFRHFPFF